MSATATAVVNGVLPPAQDVADEIAEFEKILKLRDEIFAGNHPRLTVPAHLLRKVSPASSSHSSVPVQAQQLVQLPGLNLSQDAEQSKSTPPVQPSSTVSGIHPALLTKSDDLIRAEATLHRQRLEKQLRDQFEQKRLDFRKRPAPAEAKPDFDISALLAKALDVVKPVSLSKDESDKDDENDSFDENSFYSSRAPDSTPERADPSNSSQDQGVRDQAAADSTMAEPLTAPQRPSSRTQVDPHTAAKPAANPFGKSDGHAVDADDEDEEGEYSPPEADQYPAHNANSSQAPPDPRSRQMRRYSDLESNGKRPASPTEPNMRIVRNHITSPIAPQPSRVSPLAFTKDSLVSQGRQYQNGRQRGRADSPSQSPENVSARNKRRKLERKAEKRARRGIKQENVSPPPFHDIQPLGSNKLPPQDEQPIIIDEPPQPQEIRYVPGPRYVDSPQRPLSRHAEVIQVGEQRALSRTSMRPRDDQDLRRVASMHNMRVEQPREYVEYAPARQRAASYMRVDSPMREMPREYPSDNEGALQEIRVIRTPAPEYREVYSQGEPEVRYVPEPMPPPPRERIVVDQYGRRFREIVQERASVAPRAATYMPRESTQYYDNYTPVRAGSVVLEERPQRYEQDMPPPRVVRQMAQQPNDTQMSATREIYESPSAGRGGNAAMYERPARQMMYAENPADFRPPVRMSSARPPSQHQYEDQPVMQVMPRAGSVRPGPSPGREAGAFVDDRASVRREYLPLENQPQQRYRVVEQDHRPQMPMQVQPRYVDAQGRAVVPAPPDEGGVRYVQRF